MKLQEPITLDLKQGLSVGMVVEVHANGESFDKTIWHAKSEAGSSIELIQNSKDQLKLKLTNQHKDIFFSKNIEPEFYVGKAAYIGFSVLILSDHTIEIKLFVNAKINQINKFGMDFEKEMINTKISLGTSLDRALRFSSFILCEMFMFDKADDVLIQPDLWKYVKNKWSII